MAPVSLGTVRLQLRGDGTAAVGGTLFVADLHIGKETAFQSLGVPIPLGSSAATLDRLSESVAGFTELVVLGDLWHAEFGLCAEIIDDCSSFRARHPELKIRLVRGNHDRGGEELIDCLQVAEVSAGDLAQGLACHHYPPALGLPFEESDGRDPEPPWLAGHLHPGILVEAGGQSERARCFWQKGAGIILPAYGDFTGSAGIRPSQGDRVWVLAGDQVVEVPLQALL